MIITAANAFRRRLDTLRALQRRNDPTNRFVNAHFAELLDLPSSGAPLIAFEAVAPEAPPTPTINP